MVSLIKAIISTLDSVEVRGRDNLNALLGSINALETVVQALENSSKAVEEVDNG